MKQKQRKRFFRLSYTIELTLFFSAIFVIELVLIFGIFLLIGLEKSAKTIGPVGFTLILIFSSALIGTVTSFFILRSIEKQTALIKSVIKKVAHGDFEARIESSTKLPLYKDIIEEFNSMIEELGTHAILKKDFISNFSHEFKTPMVSIKGYAELLYENDDLPLEEKKKYLSIIIEESKRLTTLSNQTMLMSKLDATAIPDDLETYSIDEQIKECVLILDLQFEEKNIDVDVNLDKIIFKANKNMLKEVWINFLTNAIKYNKQDGTITIFSSKDSNNYYIHFKDTGIGMDKDALDHIFDRFYQADRSRKSVGVGLGMPITKKILEIFNCDLNVTSSINEGSDFVVTIPIIEDLEIDNKKDKHILAEE